MVKAYISIELEIQHPNVLKHVVNLLFSIIYCGIIHLLNV